MATPTPDATVAAEASRKIFSEADPTVLVVYFLAFGIWTAAAANDFISSAWKTVRQTRRRGKLHAALAFIPMILISVYILFQHKTKDYKEMGAALLALGFAVLHLGRTFMGLWQLRVFKQWTISCIKSMESLGYETRMPDNDTRTADDSDSDNDDFDNTSEIENEDGLNGEIRSDDAHVEERNGGGNPGEDDSTNTVNADESSNVDAGSHENPQDHGLWLPAFLQTFLPASLLDGKDDRVDQIADAILVNDSLIDNRFSDVPTVCNFRLFSKSEERTMKTQKSPMSRLYLRFRYGIVNILCACRLLFSLTFLKAPLVYNTKSGPRLVPRRPESVWLSWATALVAQVGWMVDDISHTDPDAPATYAERRNHFAEQILINAALHTQRMRKDAREGYSPEASDDQDGRTMSGFLAFQDWHNYPKLCGGQFCKREFLKRACKIGSGFPYRVRHSKAMETSGSARRYGYGHFEFELRRAREALPPEIETRAASFDVNKLEWFAIFVSVENWTSERSSDMEADDVNGSKLDADSKDGIESEDLVAGNDIPIENLKKQLGVAKEHKFILEESKLPFLRGVSNTNLWGNRNVLEVSCQIDNWMALCAGEQTSYMVHHIPWMERKLSSETLFSDRSSDGKASIERIVQESAEFEKYRFMCQMAVVSPEHFHLEKSITFLGCSMEMLRTSLAKWVETNEDCGEGSWKPSLSSNGSDKRGKMTTFEGSPDFTSCAQSLKCVPDMSQRFVKMRILWELQNHIQNYLQENRVGPCSIEAMALCILSFPALSMEVRHVESTYGALNAVNRRDETVLYLQNGDMEPFQVQNYEYVIHASCGPQDFQLILSFEAPKVNSNSMISLELCEAEGRSASCFDWEMWRNAFFGRLEACRRWKENIGLLSFPLISSTQHITSGVQKVKISTTALNLHSGIGPTISVWNGWLPHCDSICMYEIATEGFILQSRFVSGQTVPVDSGAYAKVRFTIPREIWEAVDYVEANGASLNMASLAAQDFLHGAFLLEGPTKMQFPLERAEMLSSQDSNADTSLALRLIESAAIDEMSIEALGKAIRMLLRKGKAGTIRRAVQLVERFYIHMSNDTGNIDRNERNLSSLFCKEPYVKAVTSLFEEIFKASEFDLLVAEKYKTFLMLLNAFAGKGTHENAMHVMLRSIISGYCSADTFASAAAILFFFAHFPTYPNFEEFALLFLAYSNFENGAGPLQRSVFRRRSSFLKDIRYAVHTKMGEAILAVAGNEGGINALKALRIDPQDAVDFLNRSIQRKEHTYAMTSLGNLYRDGALGIKKNIPRAVELYNKAIEEGRTDAMFNLAVLLCNREEGVEPNVPRAVELFNRSIDEGGNVEAMNWLANMLLNGENGVQKDPPRAVELWSKAIDGGHTWAMCRPGSLLSNGEEGIARNVPRAVELFNRSIDGGGNVEAMNWLADMILNGENGVQKDPPWAVELCSRAIEEGGHTWAMFKLAVLLCNGEEGVEPNVPRAVELFNRSIDEGGNVEAMNRLAGILLNGWNGVRKDPPRAVELWSRAIEDGGHTGAMHRLGALLCNGGEGVEPNIPRAVELFNRSIDEGGNVEAMNRLAGILLNGENDVRKDPPRAVELWSRAIEDGGHTGAMHRLGALLCNGGEGVEPNIPRAVELFNRSIDEGGNVEAMNRLAVVLFNGGNGVQKDPPRAVELWSRAIEDGGHTWAMFNLAVLLCNGEEGVQPNVPRAVELFNRSIDEGGNVEAMNRLAGILFNGWNGAQKDPPRAVELWSRAIEDGGHTWAMFKLAVLLCNGEEGVEPNVPRAVELFNRSIDEGGNVEAMNRLAVVLFNGGNGVQKDPPRAVELWSRAIEDGGHTWAMFNLAVLLCNREEGVEPNVPRAVELFNRSIDEGGNVEAMNWLAVVLLNGENGVRKDPPRAVELWSRAIEDGGHTGAMHRLGALLCRREEGVERNVPRAMELFNRSINEGANVNAMNHLAVLFLNGENGVQRDHTRAIELLLRAIEGGHTGAMTNLACLLSDGKEGVEQDVPRAAELFNRAVNEGSDAHAMIRLGLLLMKGENGVQQDRRRAEELYRRAELHFQDLVQE